MEDDGFNKLLVTINILDLEFEEAYFEFSKDSIVSHINQAFIL